MTTNSSDAARILTLKNKVFSSARKLTAHLKDNRAKEQVVFTNGCFDILHVGHVMYLNQARSLGDLLVVGLNSDFSVRLLKGDGRPVNSEGDRALVLAGLECVDYVVVFGEPTPIETLRAIKPAVHTKGGDYKEEDLPEQETVLAGGGRIEILPFQKGYSTTDILKKASESAE